MIVRLSYDKTITFTEDFEIDEHEFFHLENLRDTMPHSFLKYIKDRVSTDDCGDNYDSSPEMEVIR
jgi:hypothetical protein